MMAGITLNMKYVFCEISGVVKKATPSLANPKSRRASSEMKLKMSYPALVRRTNSAMTNCISIPTITVCHTILLRLREVAQKPKMKTKRPKSETARLARVLSSLSLLAKDPTMMTAIVRAAAEGIRIFSGMRFANLVPVLAQTQCIGLVTTVMGMCRVMRRIIMANQNRNGMIQFLSWRCTTTLAIHHLILSARNTRDNGHEDAPYPVKSAPIKTWIGNLNAL